tara:strand:+ start:78 stop:617 length:540 start_codon:yes stop_codon:yes gene_type:complete
MSVSYEYEVERLAAIEQSRLLSDDADKIFNHIVETLSVIVYAPIAAITILDANKQWFLSSKGLDLESTPKSEAICSHTIQSSDIFVVENTTKDNRFQNKLLVNNTPFIRSYAGLAIRDKNMYPLGAICVIDKKPRTFTPAELKALKDIRAVTEKAIALIAEGRNTKSIELEVDSVLIGD